MDCSGDTIRLPDGIMEKVTKAKKMAEGHTKMEAIRCLKRYIAREVYYTIKKQSEHVNCS